MALFNMFKNKKEEKLENPFQKYDFNDPAIKTYLITVEVGDNIERPASRSTFKFKSKATGDELYSELDKLLVDWVNFKNQYSSDKYRSWDANIICFTCLG